MVEGRGGRWYRCPSGVADLFPRLRRPVLGGHGIPRLVLSTGECVHPTLLVYRPRAVSGPFEWASQPAPSPWVGLGSTQGGVGGGGLACGVWCGVGCGVVWRGVAWCGVAWCDGGGGGVVGCGVVGSLPPCCPLAPPLPYAGGPEGNAALRTASCHILLSKTKPYKYQNTWD